MKLNERILILPPPVPRTSISNSSITKGQTEQVNVCDSLIDYWPLDMHFVTRSLYYAQVPYIAWHHFYDLCRNISNDIFYINWMFYYILENLSLLCSRVKLPCMP